MKAFKNIAYSVLQACTRQKPIQYSGSTDTELRRCLSTLDLTLIGIGSTLGSGIYVLTGEVAKNKAGPAIVLSFLIAGLASILSGLCYAEFGARVPKAGSAYVYCYLTVGEFCAFIIGWNVVMEYIIGASAVARSLSAYVDSIAGGVIKNKTLSVIGEMHVPGFSNYFDFLALSIVLMFTVVLSCGVKNSARFNNLCVVCNIATALIVIVVGFVYADVSNWSNFTPFGFQGVISGASTCFFAFIGFDVIATTSEEAKTPSKSIPISIIVTIAVCCLAYVGVSGAVTLMVPYYKLQEDSAVSTAFYQRNLKFMGYIVGVGAIFGLLGCTLISMVPLPRLLYAISQDGLLMKFFSHVHSKTQVPIYSTVFSGIFVGILAATLDLDALVEMMSIGTLLAYSIVDICVIILRYKDTSKESKTEEESCSEKSEDALNGSSEDAQNGPSEDVTADSKTDNGVVVESDEKTVLLEKHSQDSLECLGKGCNFQNTSLVFNLVIISIVLILLGISVTLSQYAHKIIEKNFVFVLLLLCLVLMLFCCGFYLSRLKQHVDGLNFKVPLVPFVPILALFFNIYLVLSLSHLTWIRLAVWLAIGLIIYFAYSMHHSEERHLPENTNEDGYVLLEMKKQHHSKKNTTTGNTVLLKSPSKID